MRIAVKRGGGHGDVLLTTPVLKALKRKYPDSEIIFVTDRNNLVILKGLPYIDRFIVCKNFYEVCYCRVAGCDRVFNLLYEKMCGMHIIDAYARIADVELVDKKPEIVITQDHEREAKRFFEYYNIKQDSLLIGIHRGPTWPCRSWDVNKFRQVVYYMKEKYGAIFVEFSGQAGYGAGIGIDITGKTSVRQTAAILKRCSMLLCIDSFIMHLASVFDVPTVAIFGCTNPALRLPFNGVCVGVQTKGECKSCYHDGVMKTYKACPRDRIYCMEEVSAQEVIEKMEELLKRLGHI